MRKRRLRLALLAVAFFGVVAWLVWPKSSAVVTAAREKYAQLQLGMSEAEVAAILGGPPERHVQCYGKWVDDRKLYLLKYLRDVPNPEPGQRLYDLHSWVFADGDSWGRPHHIAVQGVFDQGRLVELLCSEWQDNAAKKWLRGLAARLSIRLRFLDVDKKDENQAVPPS